MLPAGPAARQVVRLFDRRRPRKLIAFRSVSSSCRRSIPRSVLGGKEVTRERNCVPHHDLSRNVVEGIFHAARRIGGARGSAPAFP
jgi:hypothetical protein